MDDVRTGIVEKINVLDGVAIFLVVLYHVCERLNHPYGLTINTFIGVIGLTCFTFSAGLKFSHNHYSERADRQFLGRYFVRRFVRLYKAYIGFSVIMVGIIGVMFLISAYIPNFYPGIANYSPELYGARDILLFIEGINPVAYHLWYLVALLVITALCFSVLYSRILPLPVVGLAVIAFDVLFWIRLHDFSLMLFRIMAYLPVFIGGMYWDVLREQVLARKMQYFLPAAMIGLFGGALLWHTGLLVQYDILTFGLTIPVAIYVLSGWQVNRHLWKALSLAGFFSFPIYLFHPLVLNISNIGLLGFLKSSHILYPLPLTLIVMILSVAVYYATKKVRINVIFE